jgi:hypothetical protein
MNNVTGHEERLGKHLAKVYEIMKDGVWRTLPHIQNLMGGRVTTQSVSARLRDLRKKKYGGYLVESNHLGGGLYEYRLDVNRRNEPKESDTVVIKVWTCDGRTFLSEEGAKKIAKRIDTDFPIIEHTRVAIKA